MDAGFGNDVGVQAVAEIDGVYIVTDEQVGAILSAIAQSIF